MKSLKSSGFVTNIKEDGDRRYTLDLPLPSFVHELMLILVLLTEAPPARVAKDSSDPPLEADRQHLLRNLENELLSREIEAFFAQLFKPRGIRQRLRDLNELEREVDSIRASIDRIRNKTDSDPN